ncbi:hypothetical protein ABIB00_002842 [Bradyrhizobium sp. LB14.3]|jgi:hypothetical protein|uniref:hypothetical protein n=2 Tax=unclassified Bradyrhizobium TaxID=2631580 RepID=UPI00339B390A
MITYSTPILHLINAIRGDWLWSIGRPMPARRAFSKLADRLANLATVTADDRHLLTVAPAALGEGLQQRLSAGLHADEVLLKLDEVAKRANRRPRSGCQSGRPQEQRRGGIDRPDRR